METPPIEQRVPGAVEARRTLGVREHRVRLAVWSVLAAALVLFILFGSVSAISYRYYSYSGRLVRLHPHRSLIDIWSDGVAALPSFSIGWLPGAVVVLCLAITVLCAIAGAWMLLVQDGGHAPRRVSRAG